MRVAVISDVHGNAAALDAVLADAAAADVTAYWILGDLVAYGPRPAETLDRIRGLGDVRCVRGNTDRYVLTGDVSGMQPRVDEPRTEEERRVLAEVLGSLAWTRDAVAAAGHERWLSTRPVEERVILPNGPRVLLAHASPGRDDGAGAHPDGTDADLHALGFTRDAADLVLVGHTHVPLDRAVHGVRVVNPGAVSLPRSRDGLARWALLTADEEGYDVGCAARRTTWPPSSTTFIASAIRRRAGSRRSWVRGSSVDERGDQPGDPARTPGPLLLAVRPGHPAQSGVDAQPSQRFGLPRA